MQKARILDDGIYLGGLSGNGSDGKNGSGGEGSVGVGVGGGGRNRGGGDDGIGSSGDGAGDGCVLRSLEWLTKVSVSFVNISCLQLFE